MWSPWKPSARRERGRNVYTFRQDLHHTLSEVLHAAQEALKGVGGRLDAFYYAFGETDVFAIADVPDNVSAAALSLTVSASGAVNTKITVLLTPEEIDQAAQKTVGYRSPGH